MWWHNAPEPVQDKNRKRTLPHTLHPYCNRTYKTLRNERDHIYSEASCRSLNSKGRPDGTSPKSLSPKEPSKAAPALKLAALGDCEERSLTGAYYPASRLSSKCVGRASEKWWRLMDRNRRMWYKMKMIDSNLCSWTCQSFTLKTIWPATRRETEGLPSACITNPRVEYDRTRHRSRKGRKDIA